MIKLELVVRYTNGKASVERVERDTPQGRSTIDKVAFAMLARSDVESAKVNRTRRTAQTGRRSYR